MPESRDCEDCGKPYALPIPYEQANPVIRDKCVECISVMQREHVKTDEKPVKKEEWF